MTNSNQEMRPKYTVSFPDEDVNEVLKVSPEVYEGTVLLLYIPSEVEFKESYDGCEEAWPHLSSGWILGHCQDGTYKDLDGSVVFPTHWTKTPIVEPSM